MRATRWRGRAIGSAAVLLALPQHSASAQVPTDAPKPVSGLEVGLRTGYLVPFGKVSSADPLSLGDHMAGKVPLTIAVGGRTHTHYSIALAFTYGVGILGSKQDDQCKQDVGTCSVHDTRIGPELLYHFAPNASLDPWASLGLGYEWWTLHEDVNGVLATLTASGFEFLNLQGGVAFPIAGAVTIAPSLSFGLGRFGAVSSSECGYDVCFVGSSDVQSKAWHGWVGLGVRVTVLVETRRRHAEGPPLPPPPPPPPP